MSFALIIFVRVLFVACMVFILGYIFGSFGKRPVLKTLSKVSAILIIGLFIVMNILFVRAAIGGRWHHGPRHGGMHGGGSWQEECPFSGEQRDGQDSLQRPASGTGPVAPDSIGGKQSPSSVTLTTR